MNEVIRKAENEKNEWNV